MPADPYAQFQAPAIDPYAAFQRPLALGDQPASFSGVASIMADQAGRATGAAWDTLKSTPGLFLHPLDAMQQAFGYSTDAIGRLRAAISAGDAKEAVLSAVGAVPLVGPGAEQVSREIADGQYPEAIGHIAAARILAEAPGVLRKAPAAARAIAGDITHIAGDITLPGAGAMLGGIGQAAVGAGAMAEGGPVGMVVGAGKIAEGAKQFYKGLQKRAAAAAEARAATAAPPPVDPATLSINATAPVPPLATSGTAAQYAPPPTSTGPLPAAPARAGLALPSTLDPAARVSAPPLAPVAAPPVAGGQWPVPSAAAPTAAASFAAPEVSIDLLNQTARSLGGRSFATLQPGVQDFVRRVIAKDAQAGARGQTPGASPAPIPPPASASELAPGPRPLAPAETPPAVTTIPQARPDVPAQVFEDAARAKKTAPVAQLLHDSAISHADASGMTDEQWGIVAKAAGVNPLSKISQADALFRLRKLELGLPEPSPALVDALNAKPGTMALAQAMQAQLGPP